MPQSSPIGRITDFAMTTAEVIEERFGDETSIGAISIVIDLHTKNTEGQVINPILAVCDDPRIWVQAALLKEASEQAEAENQARADAVEDDHSLRDDDEDEDD